MAAPPPDLPLLVKQYIRRMLSETGQGMKSMLLDSYTTGIVSCVLSQTEILQKDVRKFPIALHTSDPEEMLSHSPLAQVVLIERLDSDVGEAMLHLKARPEASRGFTPQRSELTRSLPFPAGCVFPKAHCCERDCAQEALQDAKVWRISPMCEPAALR